MKISFAMAAVMAASAVLGGCATAPENISADYVPSAMYSSMDCSQTKEELMRVSSEVSKVTGEQRKKATNDKWATGVGIVLFWPALFFLASGDKKDQLAHLKGQYDALVMTAKQKKCVYADELRPS